VSSAGPARRPERLAIAFRSALLALAAAAAALSVALAVRSPVADAAWTCPMHPEVRSARPGACTLCGMALVPLAPAAPPAAGAPPRLPTGAVEAVRSQVVSEPFLAPGWVEGERVVARVEDDALPLPAELVFHPSAMPSLAVPVRTEPGPSPAWDRSTSRVQLRLATGAQLAPGTAGWVEGPARPRRIRQVPLAAVLERPDGPYVLVRTATGAFLPRDIRYGRVLDGSAAVLSGLEEGERVLVRSAFFVDAERRLSAPTGAPGG